MSSTLSQYPSSTCSAPSQTVTHRRLSNSTKLEPIGSHLESQTSQTSAASSHHAESTPSVKDLLYGSEPDICSCSDIPALKGLIADKAAQLAISQADFDACYNFNVKLRQTIEEERGERSAWKIQLDGRIKELESQLVRSAADARFHQDHALRLEDQFKRTLSALQSELLARLTWEREATSLQERVDELELWKAEVILRNPSLDPDFEAAIRQRASETGLYDLLSSSNLSDTKTSGQSLSSQQQAPPYPEHSSDSILGWQPTIRSLEIDNHLTLQQSTQEPHRGRDTDCPANNGATYMVEPRAPKPSRAATDRYLQGVLDVDAAAC